MYTTRANRESSPPTNVTSPHGNLLVVDGLMTRNMHIYACLNSRQRGGGGDDPIFAVELMKICEVTQDRHTDVMGFIYRTRLVGCVCVCVSAIRRRQHIWTIYQPDLCEHMLV